MTQHPLSPAADETLNTFLRRAMKERGLSVPKLVQRLVSNELVSATNAERMVKRLRSGKTRSIKPETAALLGPALNADFAAFLYTGENGNGPSVTAAQFLEEVRQLAAEVADLRERLAALEQRPDPGEPV